MSSICRVCAGEMPKDRKGPDQVCPKCLSKVSQKQYARFMLESNKIEGEDRINPGDVEAVEYIIASPSLCVGCILQVHKLLGAYLKQSWVGKFRTVEVVVGGHKPPPVYALESLMDTFVRDLDKMDSWTAHNKFEYIHPFRDLNGRTGRLIWLSKALQEGYNFKIPFLQMYYYQTLEKFERYEDPSLL